ncbi:MAG: LysR family transcriptional regulator [Pantoea agglomerans]
MIDDIRYLIVFAKIVEAGTISGGAEALGLTAATASTHLSRLEKNIGGALLYRNTRKISLTNDGAKLLETANSILELYEKGFIEFKQRSVSTTNKLNISIPAVFINSDFTRHLASFINDYPGVCLNVCYSDTRKDIIADSIDVAFRIGELPDSSLKARHLFVLPRQVVASNKFLRNYPVVNHPDDLQKIPWIGLSMRQNSREFRHKNGEVVLIKYMPTVCVDNIEAAYVLSKQQIGISAPPCYLCKEDIKREEMEVVLPDWSLEPLKVYAIWPSNIPTSSIAYKLINKIYNSFKSHEL